MRFGINGAYTDATLDNNAPSLGGRAGDLLPFVPVYSASATIDYYFTLPFWHTMAERQQVPGGDAGKNIAASDSKIVPGLRTESAEWNGHVGAGFRWVSGQWSEVESSKTAIRTPAYGAMDLERRPLQRKVDYPRVRQKCVGRTRLPNCILKYQCPDWGCRGCLGTPIQPRTVGVEVDCKF